MPGLSSVLVKTVANDCNLDCTYCFYKRTSAIYGKGRHRMPEEVLRELVRQMFGLDLPQVAFSWQGGEPTLAGTNFFRRVFELQNEFGRGRVVGNSIQTNAVLIDREWARLLARYNVLVGVSLDGPREIHDRYRRDLSGEGSFDRVQAAIEELRTTHAQYNILCLVTAANVERAREVYRFLVSEGHRFLQFIPCLEKDPATGERAEFAVDGPSYGRFLCELYDEWTKEGRGVVSVLLFDALLEKDVRGSSSFCVLGSSCDSYLVIEHNGDVYPCDFFVTPEWKLGNIMEASLEELARTEKRKEFARQKSAAREACGECRWWRVCKGGCVKDRVALGRPAAERTEFCESMRALLDRSWRDFEEMARRVRTPLGAPMEARAEGPSRSEARDVPPAQVRRNDPCPCGSGLKYKNCCMRKETRARRTP